MLRGVRSAPHMLSAGMDAARAQTTTSEAPEGGSRRVMLALGALAVAAWAIPLGSSLWLDEAGTFWVIRGSVANTIEAAARYQGQTPAYYVLEWLIRRVAGANEIALRAPSFVAMLITLWLLYRLAVRLGDTSQGMPTVIAFAVLSPVAFAASDARPYAIALMFSVGSTLALVRWLDRGSGGITYVLLVAATITVHYLFAIVLVPHAIYAIHRARTIRVKPTLAVCGGLAVLLAPTLPQLAALFDRRASLSVVLSHNLDGLLALWAPAALIAGAGASLLIAARLRPTVRPVTSAPSSLLLAAAWLIVPSGVLFVLTEFTSTDLFFPRYLLISLPGLALLIGRAIAALEAERVRVFVLAGMLVATASVGMSVTHADEGWREASALLNRRALPGDKVLLHAYLIESAQLDWLSDPERSSYLNAPLAPYPIRARAYAVPYRFDDLSIATLDALVQQDLVSLDRFFFVTRASHVPWEPWLRGRLASEGFTSTQMARFGHVVVHEFHRVYVD